MKLSSLKGEAELRNLALNPSALQDLLNLPTWLKINSATVNSVALKIQWMQLQKQPIRISLDLVKLEAEALQEPRAPNGPSPIQERMSKNKFLNWQRFFAGNFFLRLFEKNSRFRAGMQISIRIGRKCLNSHPCVLRNYFFEEMNFP